MVVNGVSRSLEFLNTTLPKKWLILVYLAGTLIVGVEFGILRRLVNTN
jgi:hypothetical protein